MTYDYSVVMEADKDDNELNASIYNIDDVGWQKWWWW